MALSHVSDVSAYATNWGYLRSDCLLLIVATQKGTMRKTTRSPGEKIVKDIKRVTRNQYLAQTVQPDPTPSGLKHAPANSGNLAEKWPIEMGLDARMHHQNLNSVSDRIVEPQSNGTPPFVCPYIACTFFDRLGFFSGGNCL